MFKKHPLVWEVVSRSSVYSAVWEFEVHVQTNRLSYRLMGQLLDLEWDIHIDPEVEQSKNDNQVGWLEFVYYPMGKKPK